MRQKQESKALSGWRRLLSSCRAVPSPSISQLHGLIPIGQKKNGSHPRQKVFICYAVLANDTLAYGNAIMEVDAVTQASLTNAIEKITASIHEQKPEINFQNLTIIFIKELEG